jgi:hypothetical protein
MLENLIGKGNLTQNGSKNRVLNIHEQIGWGVQRKTSKVRSIVPTTRTIAISVEPCDDWRRTLSGVPGGIACGCSPAAWETARACASSAGMTEVVPDV